MSLAPHFPHKNGQDDPLEASLFGCSVRNRSDYYYDDDDDRTKTPMLKMMNLEEYKRTINFYQNKKYCCCYLN